MRIQGTSEGNTGIEVTPLIDILFTLIIFFLATATFQEQERDAEVKLPNIRDWGGQGASDALTINVAEDGEYTLGANTCSLERLFGILKTALAEEPSQKVLIRGDENAKHGDVARAIGACYKAGFTSAKIAFQWNVERKP
jgi:biopolymer transport protein ExbD